MQCEWTLLIHSRSKRSFGDSPNPSTTSSISYNIQSGAIQDRSYGYNPSKRQRSDSDYSAHLYHTPQLGATNAMYPYAVQPASNQHVQGTPTSQPETYGHMLGQGQTQLAPVSQQKDVLQILDALREDTARFCYESLEHCNIYALTTTTLVLADFSCLYL